MSQQIELNHLLIAGDHQTETNHFNAQIKQTQIKLTLYTEKLSKKKKEKYDACLCFFEHYCEHNLISYIQNLKPLCDPTTPIIALMPATQSYHPALSGFDSIAYLPMTFHQILPRIENIQRLKTLENELISRLQTLYEFNIRPNIPVKEEAEHKLLYVGESHPCFIRLQNLFKKKPVEIFAAFTSFTAFDWIYSQSIDLIILNAIEHPENALSICRALRRNSSFYHLPIIMLQNEAINRPEDYASIRVTDVIFPNSASEEIESRILSLLHERQRRLIAKETLKLTQKPEVMDTETHLYNQDFLLKHIKHLAQNADLYQYPLSACSMIIHLSNDSNSHLSEKTRLKIYQQWGEMLSQLVRIEDCPARIDENIFIYLLPATNLKGAEIIQKRLEGVATCAAFDYEKGSPVKVKLLSNISEKKIGEAGVDFLKRSVQNIIPNPPKAKQKQNNIRDIVA